MSAPNHNQKQFHHMAGDGLSAPPGYRDFLDMTNGDDHRHGGNAPDILYGYDGNDRFRGNNGPDELYGGNGSDRLGGGRSGDTIDGGADADSIRGGAGGDTLTGGSGEDSFRYRHTGDSTGGGGDRDVIQDFETGVDRIVLRDEFAGITAADIHITDDGSGGVVVTIDGTNFQLASKTVIAISDFHF